MITQSPIVKASPFLILQLCKKPVHPDWNVCLTSHALRGASQCGIRLLSLESYICGSRHNIKMRQGCQLTHGRTETSHFGSWNNIVQSALPCTSLLRTQTVQTSRCPTCPTPSPSSATMQSQQERWWQIFMPFLHHPGSVCSGKPLCSVTKFIMFLLLQQQKELQ